MRVPYGLFLTDDGSRVLFDRHYQPIARFRGGPDAPAMTIPAAHCNRPVVLPIGSVTPCQPGEWVAGVVGRIWLWDDRTSPSRNRSTRDRLAMLSTVLAALTGKAVPA
jgi:hypothetical protein